MFSHCWLIGVSNLRDFFGRTRKLYGQVSWTFLELVPLRLRWPVDGEFLMKWPLLWKAGQIYAYFRSISCYRVYTLFFCLFVSNEGCMSIVNKQQKWLVYSSAFWIRAISCARLNYFVSTPLLLFEWVTFSSSAMTLPFGRWIFMSYINIWWFLSRRFIRIMLFSTIESFLRFIWFGFCDSIMLALSLFA